MQKGIFALIVIALAAALIYVFRGNGVTQLTEITNETATWPSGDKTWNIARAIALAEGANVAGSNPDRLNNPGDISDGGSTFGGECHSGSRVTAFPDKKTGWQWLYNKINNIKNGASCVYDAQSSWNVIAQSWAGDWRNWVSNVCAELGVSPESTMADYYND